ncbi:hypothetical protein RFI_21735, partial [Reticulomyxa filosa]
MSVYNDNNNNNNNKIRKDKKKAKCEIHKREVKELINKLKPMIATKQREYMSKEEALPYQIRLSRNVFLRKLIEAREQEIRDIKDEITKLQESLTNRRLALGRAKKILESRRTLIAKQVPRISHNAQEAHDVWSRLCLYECRKKVLSLCELYTLQMNSNQGYSSIHGIH